VGEPRGGTEDGGGGGRRSSGLRMKMDGNGRENSSPVFVAVFFYRKRERDGNSRKWDGNRDKRVYGNEQIRTGIQRKWGGNRKLTPG